MKNNLFITMALAGALFLAPHMAFASGGGGGHGGASKEAKPKSSSSQNDGLFVKMEPMLLPVINDRGIQEVVSMVVALEVKDEQSILAVKSVVPRLNDAYMRALYGHIDRAIYRNGRFLDVTKLKTRLTAITESMVGKELVRDVLIQGINQRRYN
jgi:flagellar basal body-associated protein FliL